MIRKFIPVWLLVFGYSAILLAGTTGKIAGRVTEAGTGDPLPGVNVLVSSEGAGVVNTGAATDLEGFYVVLNLQPGTYTVTASFVGYTEVTYKNVRVYIDRTTNIDFTLREELVEGDVIEVVAEREMIKKDVSTSVFTADLEQVESMPVTSVENVVELQAGVTEGLSIRNAGADELLYQVDGVTMRDPRTNQPVTGIPLSSIQEISLERGGFNAEYGQVRSGILNVVTREGGMQKYSAEVLYRNSPPARKYFGTSPFDKNSFWLRPYLDPEVAFVGTEAGWDEFTRQQYRKFDGWNHISNILLSDNDPTNDLTPEGAQRLFEWQHRREEVVDQSDYEIDLGFGGPVPFLSNKLGNMRFYTAYRRVKEMLMIPLTRDDYTEYNWSLKLTSDLAPGMKLDLFSNMGKSYNIAVNGTEQITSTDYIRSPWQIANQVQLQPFTTSSRIFSDSYYSLAEVSHFSTALQFTHALSSRSFYETSLELLQRKYNTEPTGRRDESEIYEIVPGYYTNEAPFGWSPESEVGIGDDILFGGHTSTARDYSTISTIRFKGDFSSQVTRNHQIKTGIQFDYDNLDLEYGVVNLRFPESNDWVDWNKNPIRAALYIQDKWEADGFIANVGLRFDYSDANTEWVDVNKFNPYFSGNYDPEEDYPKKEAKRHFYISPRLAISHPITESSKLFFNYGHFNQLPTSEQMFQISRGAAQQVRQFGDPNLVPARTIAYELGYDHAILDQYLVQLAAYYRDIKDQLAYTWIYSADNTVNYRLATTNSYEDIRGFELTLRKNPGRWWSGFVTYTYQVNTAGLFGKREIWQDPSQQRKYDERTTEQYQDKPLPQPWANALIDLHTPMQFGPQLLGMHPLEKWGVSILSRWRAGNYYTWPSRSTAVRYNLQMRDNFNTDIRLSKTLKVSDYTDVSLLMDVYNVFNNKQMSMVSFYNFDDYENYFSSLHLPRSDAYDNIVGDDKPGDYRKTGVPYQPIIPVGGVVGVEPKERAIYYDRSTGKYMEHDGMEWNEVSKSRMNKIIDDKAYIDMPNQSSFNFLYPRDIYIGLRMRFHF